jgi:cold-inducible RNA-binding protein
MNSKVYVGNVSFLATEDDLQILFSRAGTVASIALVRDQETGHSKGFAFVEMSSPAEAQKAISMFNGFCLGDRRLRVNLAQLREVWEEGSMSDAYTRKQAMERLGIWSTNSFLFLTRKYPEAFVNVNQGTDRDKKPLYDKATLDDFARRREYFKEGAKREKN